MKKYKNNRNPDKEMHNPLKKTPKIKTEEIRDIIDKILKEANKRMLGYDKNIKNDKDRSITLTSFLEFLLEDVQNGLRKIDKLSHEIDKEEIVNQRKNKK